LTDLDSANYDLIITITSDAMLPALHSIKKTPWLFTNVNNPKFLGINDETQHSRNVSGVTYYIPAIRQLEFFREVMGGKLKKVGFIFDYYAKSRRAELGEFRFAAMELGIAHEIFLIRNVHDLPGAAKKLMDMEAEAVILTSSDTIYNHTASIVEICNTRNIPVFSVNREGVVHGAIAALASDYYLMVDKCLLPMAISVLKKVTQPAEMPIRSIQSPSVYLNIKQAEKLGIKIPENIRAMPSLVF
jgi:putative ABC transport system substrate-binding protein